MRATTLRTQLIDALQPYVRDLVIAAPDRPWLGALVWLDATACPKPAARRCGGPRSRGCCTPFNERAGGSSTRIQRLLPLDEPPQAGAGEVTDKRSINARRVLERRAADVARLYAEPRGPRPSSADCFLLTVFRRAKLIPDR